jgi:hypothetical protein
MSPEAQRIAIAEACPGLTFGIITGNERDVWKWPNGKVTSDPLSDLNAMHEAEKVLSKEQYQEYLRQLIITGGFAEQDELSDEEITGYFWFAATAPAAQRAEAFLRALNLWKDDA